MDFHLPPLCSVSLGFSFNLKRIGRRGLGCGGREGGGKAWGKRRREKQGCCVVAMKLHQIGILSLLEFGTHHEKVARRFESSIISFQRPKTQNKPKKTAKAPLSTLLETVCFYSLGRGKQMNYQIWKPQSLPQEPSEGQWDQKQMLTQNGTKEFHGNSWETFPSLGHMDILIWFLKQRWNWTLVF